MSAGRLALAVTVVIIIVAALGAAIVVGKEGHTSGGNTPSSSTGISTSLTDLYSDGGQITLSAGGSTFVAPVMQQWIFGYGVATDGNVETNYVGVGSGAGITGILTNTFNFAGSDAPVNASTLAKYPGNTLLEIPESLGGVAIIYNIPGINNATLKFTGSILAAIYNQTIRYWNDPRITSLNPGIPLPNQEIIPVHRSDGSGTTYAFTTYLNEIYPKWNSTIGVGTSVYWPPDELAGAGSGGLSGVVGETPFSIGYVDSYYAAHNAQLITMGEVKNSAGNFEMPTLAAVSAAAAAFSSQVQADPTYPIMNAPGNNSYPISTFTYLLVWKDQSNHAIGDAIATFFWYIIHAGQSYGPILGYPELPSNLVTIDEGLVEQINYNGAPYIQPG